MSVRIGSMRHRVTVERNDPVTDAGGGSSGSWSIVATVWARINDYGTSPSTHAARAAEQASLQLTIRHRSDVVAGMRLTHDGAIYRIRSVADSEQRGRYLELSCEKVAGV